MDEIIRKASVLVEALPYIKNFRGKAFVIKYGGSTMEYEDVKGSVLEDIVFLSYVGIRPVVVHGGGPSITKRMKQLGKKAEFVDGFRVTDLATMKIVEEELEIINERLVGAITRLGGDAVGLSGKDDQIIVAEKIAAAKDLGYAGKIKS